MDDIDSSNPGNYCNPGTASIRCDRVDLDGAMLSQASGKTAMSQ